MAGVGPVAASPASARDRDAEALPDDRQSTTSELLLERLLPKPEEPAASIPLPPIGTLPPPTTRTSALPNAHPSAPETRVLVTRDDLAKIDLRVGVVDGERVKRKDKLCR